MVRVTQMGQQRRRRRIAMTAEERDGFLARQHTCRVATVGADGAPHVTPMWFVWHDGALWLYSIIRSQRWVNLERDPRVSAVIDAGEGYFELHGVELVGTVEFIGEQPRVGDPARVLEEPERLFAAKYAAGGRFGYDRRHAWIRLQPAQEVSWDFRKLGQVPDSLTSG
jgi:PPOX class probable F420-dependent enzyme